MKRQRGRDVCLLILHFLKHGSNREIETAGLCVAYVELFDVDEALFLLPHLTKIINDENSSLITRENAKDIRNYMVDLLTIHIDQYKK